MQISTSKDPPCKTCLKYTICNSLLREELSHYQNPSDVHTISVVVISDTILNCKDFEKYVDDMLEDRFPGNQIPPSGQLDVVIYLIVTQTFNLDNIKGYPHDIK